MGYFWGIAERSEKEQADKQDQRLVRNLCHTFVIQLAQAVLDLYMVQMLMHHKSPPMTQHYAHHYSKSLRDGVDILDSISTKLSQSGMKEIAGGVWVIVRMVDSTDSA